MRTLRNGLSNCVSWAMEHGLSRLGILSVLAVLDGAWLGHVARIVSANWANIRVIREEFIRCLSNLN